MSTLQSDLSEKSIDQIRNELSAKTVRATSQELESVLYHVFPVLDNGFIRVIDYMGTDASIVQAARVSYGIGTKKNNEDKGLINYLLRHQHTTPFEMCEIKLHVKLPIFVARQWIRHRTANVNEYSARYSILNKEFYVPEKKQMSAQSLTNKQGKSNEAFSDETSEMIKKLIENSSQEAYNTYSHLINDVNLTRELSRMVLPVNFYTEWYWKIDLHNLMHFLRLRADSHAQYEIQCYANIILDILKKWVPYTYDAFMNYKKDAVSLSAQCLQIIKRIVNGEKIIQENSGLSKGEWLEFASTIGLLDNSN